MNTTGPDLCRLQVAAGTFITILFCLAMGPYQLILDRSSSFVCRAGLIWLRPIMCSRHCYKHQLLAAVTEPEERFGELSKFIACTPTPLTSTVWPALPQGELLSGIIPHLHFLIFFSFLRLWRDSCQLGDFGFSSSSLRYRLQLDGSLLGHPSWWCAGPAGLASTATGLGRDSCPHPPLPDKISGGISAAPPSAWLGCSLLPTHHTQEPVISLSSTRHWLCL